MNLFVIRGITGASLLEIIRGATPYVILLIGALLVFWLFPVLSLWLPQAAGFRV